MLKLVKPDRVVMVFPFEFVFALPGIGGWTVPPGIGGTVGAPGGSGGPVGFGGVVVDVDGEYVGLDVDPVNLSNTELYLVVSTLCASKSHTVLKSLII